ncbi:MAG: Type IV fimbrial assembly protein PilC [Candidatus Saccharicenans subterraneus]|uniref:Type IV fimbrial assembly protein PilC n=1 Tax=Candidatus Saccharicenans subterraneus TaxID=2508984 RepID=A0A3E2BND8_9BACT|nr:MAG: Type IV fimbrial assembly protein PilC [Candidatus Saccharicenans subterraneum]
MPVYVWTGKNRYGDMVGGERVAESAEELTRALQKDQIAVISIKQKRAMPAIPFLKREKVRLKELAFFSRQLSVLIDAELPLIQSLGLLAEQQKNKYFNRVITEVKEDVEAGSALHQALRKHPKVFDDLYCNLVASGEQSGSLDTMLRRLADYQESMIKLRAKVRQAMIYPTAIITFAILVAIFMLWKVIPVFGSIYQELGAQLPALTAFVLTLSRFVQKFIVIIFIGLVALVVGFRYWRNTPPGRQAVDRGMIKFPVMGNLMKKIALSRFTRTLSTLISGGVPMLESLKIASTTTGNVIIEGQILQARQLVSEGKSLNDALKEAGQGQFPPMMIQMVNVGESTGTLDEMLSKLANFFDDEVDDAVTSLLAALEPMVLIFVGGIVGGLVISMYLPLFNLIQQF